MNIHIFQTSSPNIEKYSILSQKNIQQYANKFEYNYTHFDIDDNYEPTTHWAKVHLLKKYISEHLDDWIWVLDSDIIIKDNNFDLKLFIKHILSINENINFIISENGLNGGELVNSGSFLIKVSYIEKLLFECNKYQITNGSKCKDYWHDQTFINEFIKNFPNDCKILDMNILNSWWVSPMDDSKFICHIMARGIDEKFDIMTELLHKYV